MTDLAKPQALKDIRIIDADNCQAIYADPAARSIRVSPIGPTKFLAPLLVLNVDECVGTNMTQAALAHTLAYRVPPIHYYLRHAPEAHREDAIHRLFGEFDADKAIVPSERSLAMVERYRSGNHQHAFLQEEWAKAVIALDVKKMQKSETTPEFRERRAALETTLSQIPLDESVVLKALGVEYLISNRARALRSEIIGDCYTYRPTRSVMLAPEKVDNYEQVWEESFHTLVNHALSKGRPEKGVIEEWIRNYPKGLHALEEARQKAVPGAYYYTNLRHGIIEPAVSIDEMIVDCNRVARAKAAERGVTIKGGKLHNSMQKEFGWVWDLVQYVHAEIAAHAYVHAARNNQPEEAAQLFANLEEVRCVGSIEILPKPKLK